MVSVKRKREGKSTEIVVSSFTEEPSLAVGSFFNGLEVPTETEFNLYKQKHGKVHEIHGENDRLEYTATTDNDDNHHAYCIAVYDPKTKTVDLVEAPVLAGKVIAKSKKTYTGPKIKQLGVRNNVQRNALGEAFGTKKAKSAITNLERNKVDAEKLQDLEMDIVDSVRETTSALPTREQMEAKTTSDRPTPVADVEATNVEDIYPIESIIPNFFWDSIPIAMLLDDSSVEQKLENLPYTESHYIVDKLKVIGTSQDRVKLLYYLSMLMGIYHNRRSRDKQILMSKFRSQPPESLVDNALSTFTVAKSSTFGKTKDRSFFIDPHNEDKLLCYILAIIFHLDSFLIQLQPLSHEFNIKQGKLANLCRIMGAAVAAPNKGQAEAMNIPKALQANSRVATLKVPFKLPDMSRRVRKGR